jgi:hypothetical protein
MQQKETGHTGNRKQSKNPEIFIHHTNIVANLLKCLTQSELIKKDLGILLLRMACENEIVGVLSTHSFIHSEALIDQDGPLASLLGVSWSHIYRHMAGLLWTSDQPYTEQHDI